MARAMEGEGTAAVGAGMVDRPAVVGTGDGAVAVAATVAVGVKNGAVAEAMVVAVGVVTMTFFFLAKRPRPPRMMVDADDAAGAVEGETVGIRVVSSSRRSVDAGSDDEEQSV